MHGLIFKALCLLLLTLSCTRVTEPGSLYVAAPRGGQYDIYRLGSRQPLQYLSEQVGHLNQAIPLEPGQYLVLADCSSATVTIKPRTQSRLIAHEVHFVPPHKPGKGDRFSVQCDRHSQTRFRQHLTNHYSFILLHGKRKMLVGMMPFEPDFSEQKDTPHRFQYPLSSVKLSRYPEMKLESRYFSSPALGMMAITEPQKFGHWQFLLPGSYIIEVNGTRMVVPLREREVKVIRPALLRIEIPPEVDADLSAEIRGTTLYAELNEKHYLDLDETWPVLPGKARIRLTGSTHSQEIEMSEGEYLVKKARALMVRSDCAPWDWDCLGRRKIFLYTSSNSWPVAQGYTDVPVLFFEPDIRVGIQGSRDIRRQIPDDQAWTVLRLGRLELRPSVQARSGIFTDLTRIESVQSDMEGHSMDVPVEKISSIPLIAGRYVLAQYHSFTNADLERRMTRQALIIPAGFTRTVSFPVYLQEKKLARLKKKAPKGQTSRQTRQRFSALRSPAIR